MSHPPFVLRPPLAVDVPRYTAQLADPEVTEWLEDRLQRPIGEAEVAEFLLGGLWCRWAIDCEGVFAGVTGLRYPDFSPGAGRFFIVIGARALWGRGLGTAVARAVVRHGFLGLGLRKIVAEYLVPNEGSRIVHARAGFTVEGRLRQDAWRGGRWVDRELVSILAEEWKEPVVASRA